MATVEWNGKRYKIEGYWRGKTPVISMSNDLDESGSPLSDFINLLDGVDHTPIRLRLGRINLLRRNGLLGQDDVATLHNLKYFSTVRNVFNE